MRLTVTRLLACLAIGAAASLLLGQDVNWDLRNYHLAGPFMVLHHRINVDLDPSGLQSYLNPTLDFVYYGLAFGPLADHPRLLAAAAGLPYGLLIFAALGIAGRLIALRPGWSRRLAVLAATAAAVTGAASLVQLGTVFNEVAIAALVLFGLLLALPALDRPDQAGKRGFGAGLLLGVAAGLKMTALTAAPAFAAALLLAGAGPPLRRFRAAGLFCAAWVAGFAAVAGWWAWIVYRKFGSPFFPLFNALFRSPWHPPIDFYEVHFLPRTPLQWLFYPFWWVTWRDRALNSELAYRDPRLAIALLAVVAAGVGLLWRPPLVRQLLTRPLVFILVFWTLAYFLWLSGTAVMRYGIVLEVTGTLLAAALLARALPAPRVAAAAIVLAAALCIAWTRATDYGRIAYGERVFDVDMRWTPPDTLFVAITGPTAYLLVFIPPDANARMVGLSFLNRVGPTFPLTTRSAAMVRDNKGPIYVLFPPGVPLTSSDLALIGLDPTPGPCRPIRSNLDADGTTACEAHRLP